MRSISTLAFFTLLFSSTPVLAQPAGVDPFIHFHSVRNNRISGSVEQNRSQQLREQAALSLDAEILFRKYLSSGRIDATAIETTLKEDPSLVGEFETYFNEAAVKVTLSNLNKKLPSDSLMQDIQKKIDSGWLFPLHFHLIDPPEDPKTPAGYVRNTHGLFFHLTSIDHQNWYLYFIHEFVHAMDSQLLKSADAFDDIRTQDQIASWITVQKRSLLPAEQSFLYAWFQAGAERGLFAEWRAWVISSVYVEKLMHVGLIQQLPPAIRHLETIQFGKQNTDLNSLEKYWWELLMKNMTSPTQSLFGARLIQSEFSQWLATLDYQSISFGSLEKYLR